MDADKTDTLIAEAIAALPYCSPSAGFSSRVMAEIASETALETWRARALKAAGCLVGAWSAALAFAAAGFIYANFADIAAGLIQPGGISQAFNLLAARAALVLIKLAAAGSLAAELALAGLPHAYEIAAAALVCSAAVAAVSKGGRAAGQKI